MKTRISIALMLVAGVVLSCNKVSRTDLPAPQPEVTIRASIPDDATRVGAQYGFSWSWEATDRLTVIGEETQVFNIKKGFSAKFAEFTGRPVSGESFTILYPGVDANTADWSNQSQQGNGGTAHLRYTSALEGVDAYESFTFSSAWAAAHGGTIKQSGVLKFVIALPDEVSEVSSVALVSETPLFYSGNGEAKTDKLNLTLSGVTIGPDHLLTAWMTTSWNDLTVPAGTPVKVEVKADGKFIDQPLNFTADAVLRGGTVNTLTLSDASRWVSGEKRYASGTGVAGDPWVITTPEHMSHIFEDMAAGECRYFRLGADIDMTGMEWTPLNTVSPYDKGIDFDGDDHTISNFNCTTWTGSYASFFGVLYGKCYDVKFVNATVRTTKDGSGILGGYGGVNDLPCEVSRVHVQGSIEGKGKIGGLFGNGRGCVITACSADVVINGPNGQKCGGLVGTDVGRAITIRDSWSAGSIVSTASICGGIVGELVVEGSSIYNCYSTASVTTQYLFGGIVGRAVANQKATAANCTSYDPKNHVEKCIAWNTLLKSNCGDAGEHYSNGAVVGATAVKNYLAGCIRKPDLDFQDCTKNAELGTYVPFDQEDSDPDHPMVGGAGTFAFAYHGKAAAAGKTVSQVAKDLGWSETVWDLSGEFPKLK